ncbi:ABC transporter ATP-binding protein [Homoserinimonas sp. A447]
MNDIPATLDSIQGVSASSTRGASEAGVSSVRSDIPVLEVDDLHVEFHTLKGTARAVRGMTLSLAPGETLAVIGESGSGKSVTAEVILGILQSPPGRVTQGTVRYAGRDLLAMNPGERKTIQGKRISMIYQNALAALNPVFTVGWQIAEIFKVHEGLPMRQGKARAVDLLRRVGIADPEARVNEYPHQFSGGMRQRVMIAMAIALNPDLLIADEATTALDVTVQAQIMNLLGDLQRDSGMSLVFITHDIAIASEIADKVAVMYGGRVVEIGPIGAVLAKPSHPYTKALVALAQHDAKRSGASSSIKGTPPDLTALPVGCAFAPRCKFAQAICSETDPELRAVSSDQDAACHFAEEVRHG